MRDHLAAPMTSSPFSTESDSAYLAWRTAKLRDYPKHASELIVRISDPAALTDVEIGSMRAACRRSNMVIYATANPASTGKDVPRVLGQQFGLNRLDSNLLADEDAISSIEVVAGKSGRGYIPYSNRRLLWHTDGYYNPPSQRVRAFILHCVSPAAEGGENALLDPEIAYLLLRDQDPEHIRALMAPDAMTIPANEEAGGVRAAQTGPVFSVDEATGSLHMRYTARTRSIEWKNDARTGDAVRALETILADDSAYVFRHRLEAGQGLLCNNVLHNRAGFSDAVDTGTKRLIYRARYYDRVAGTGFNDLGR